jgi:P-type conjugative transfer protein TrbJ
VLKFARQIIAAAVLAGVTLQANAMIVFDPSNFTENLISAIQSVAMEARQASQYLTQLKQYATQVKQVTSLDDGAMDRQFNDIMNTYSTVTQYQSELAGLQGALGEVRSVINNRMNLMAASGLSWDQYLQRERDSLTYRQNGNNILSVYERQAMDNVTQRYVQIQDLQPKIMKTLGTQQSMQVMNTQLNMLTASMQDLVTLSAAEGNRKSVEAADREARDKRAIDADEAFQQLKSRQEADGWATIERLKTMNVGGKK